MSGFTHKAALGWQEEEYVTGDYVYKHRYKGRITSPDVSVNNRIYGKLVHE